MIYEAHMYNGSVIELDVEFDDTTTEITWFSDRLYEQPEYAVYVDDDGKRYPAMSWKEFEARGANSNDFGSWEEFEEWLVACCDEFYDCYTPTVLFQNDIAPYEQ